MLSRPVHVLLVALLLTACEVRQADVRVDGSSTVYPISLAMAEEYGIENADAEVSVAFSGTGGGFEKFCAGETQVNDASRVILEEELRACRAAGIGPIEIPVAFDALTVVVHPANDWVDCLTVEELRMLYAADGGVETWSDVRPSWPDREILLYSPGVDSGTFDYFAETVMGEEPIRSDFFPSENDNVLIQGVEGDVGAIGYFGYAYYLEEQERLKAVGIDAGEGCMVPDREAITSGTYTPLSRPLFIYVAAGAAERNPVLDGFVEFYLSDFAREFIADTGYPPLAPEAYDLALRRFRDRAVGSPFGAAHGASVLEVLRGATEP